MKQQTLLDLILNENEDYLQHQTGLQRIQSIDQQDLTKQTTSRAHSPSNMFDLNNNVRAQPPQTKSPMTRHIEQMMDSLGVSTTIHYKNQNDPYILDSRFTDRNYLSPQQSGILYMMEALQPEHGKECVPFTVFREVIKNIEERMLEFEERLENKEKMQHINEQLMHMREAQQSAYKSPRELNSASINCQTNEETDQTMLQNKLDKSSIDQSQIEGQSKKKSMRKPLKGSQAVSRRQGGQSQVEDELQSQVHSPFRQKTGGDSDFMINRMNLFEKKVRQLEEKMQKIVKEDDEFKKDMQKKLDIQLRKSEDFIGKFEKQGKQIVQKMEDLSDQQKSAAQYIHRLRDDLNVCLVSQERNQCDNTERLNLLDQTLQAVSQLTNATHEEFTNYKYSVDQIENDLLIMLKNYKDLLTEISGVHYLKQEVVELRNHFSNIFRQLFHEEE